MKKPRHQTPAAPVATSTEPRELRPVGAPRKFRKDDYFELKDAFSEKDAAERAVKQAIELARATVELAQQVHSHAAARAQKLMTRHGLPDGCYMQNNDALTLQRME